MPEEEEAGAQRAHRGNQHAAPRGASRGIKARPQVFRQQDEGHHHRADHRADDQGEHQEDLVLVVLNAEALPE
jgi:hypothetical protein